MSDTKHLDARASKEKIKTLIESANICHFITSTATFPLHTRPMATAGVDEEGIIWFISNKDSEKHTDLEADNRVQLLYGDQGSAEFLSLTGKAEVINDQAKIDAFWGGLARNYFEEGKKDPAVRVIRFTPLSGIYWDTRQEKDPAMLKLILEPAAEHPGDGVEEGQVAVGH